MTRPEADLSRLREVAAGVTDLPPHDPEFLPTRLRVERDVARAQYRAAFDPPTVLALLDEIEALRATVARVEALADGWRYKGEFGWGAWQEGQGPDPEGYVLDQAADRIRAALAEPSGEGK